MLRVAELVSAKNLRSRFGVTSPRILPGIDPGGGGGGGGGIHSIIFSAEYPGSGYFIPTRIAHKTSGEI